MNVSRNTISFILYKFHFLLTITGLSPATFETPVMRKIESSDAAAKSKDKTEDDEVEENDASQNQGMIFRFCISNVLVLSNADKNFQFHF